MDELAKKTGYSLASVSNKVKMLESLGMVTRRTKPGSRKVFLYTEKNLLDIMKQQLIKKQEYAIKMAKGTAFSIIEKNKNKLKSEKQKRKLKIIENY